VHNLRGNFYVKSNSSTIQIEGSIYEKECDTLVVSDSVHTKLD